MESALGLVSLLLVISTLAAVVWSWKYIGPMDRASKPPLPTPLKVAGVLLAALMVVLLVIVIRDEVTRTLQLVIRGAGLLSLILMGLVARHYLPNREGR